MIQVSTKTIYIFDYRNSCTYVIITVAESATYKYMIYLFTDVILYCTRAPNDTRRTVDGMSAYLHAAGGREHLQ